MSFKTFTAGEVLTAADVNDYLMQGVMVFASTTARDAAITSPTNGMITFQTDTNTMTQYRSGFWRATGGSTLLASSTLSASTSFNFASIPQTFRHLEIIVRVTTGNTSAGSLTFTMNSLGGTTYSYSNASNSGTSGTTNATAPTYANGYGQASVVTTTMPTTGNYIIRIDDYTSTAPKTGTWHEALSYTTIGIARGHFFLNSTAAISSLQFAVTSGLTGTVLYYGIN